MATSEGDFVGLCNQNCHVFFSGGLGVGHVIFNLHLGVGHSVLCQMEGVGHVFSNHHILKCSGPPPPPPCSF